MEDTELKASAFSFRNNSFVDLCVFVVKKQSINHRVTENHREEIISIKKPPLKSLALSFALSFAEGLIL
jgi:hypothetical protein